MLLKIIFILEPREFIYSIDHLLSCFEDSMLVIANNSARSGLLIYQQYFFNPWNRVRANPLYLRALLAPTFFPVDRVSSAFCPFQFHSVPQQVMVHHLISWGMNFLWVVIIICIQESSREGLWCYSCNRQTMDLRNTQSSYISQKQGFQTLVRTSP